MAWKTGSATDYIDLLNKLRNFCLAEKVTVAAPSAAGTGYNVNDVLTLTGGTPDTAATFTVSSVGGGGAVTGVTILNAGIYSSGAKPANPAATSVAPADGTGCTLTLTWAAALGWIEKRNSVYSGSDKELILQGDGGGAFQIFVGIRSFNDGTSYNWELAGFTGYSAGAWNTLPGISPGRYDTAEAGAYVPLRNAAITYWFFVTNRRIMVVAKMGTSYTNMYLGFTNPFGTSTEYPYPLAVIGCASLWNRLFSAGGVVMSGLCDPISSNNHTQGPAFIRDTAGTWQKFRNSVDNAGVRSEANDCVIWPCGHTNQADFAAEDQASNDLQPMKNVIPTTGVPGAPTTKILQTPGTPNPLTELFPTICVMTDPIKQILGELDNVYWASGNASVAMVSEDTLTVGSDVYTLFQQCNRTDPFAFVAIKRE